MIPRTPLLFVLGLFAVSATTAPTLDCLRAHHGQETVTGGASLQRRSVISSCVIDNRILPVAKRSPHPPSHGGHYDIGHAIAAAAVKNPNPVPAPKITTDKKLLRKRGGTKGSTEPKPKLTVNTHHDTLHHSEEVKAPTQRKHHDASKIHGNGPPSLHVDTTHGHVASHPDTHAPTAEKHDSAAKIHGGSSSARKQKRAPNGGGKTSGERSKPKLSVDTQHEHAAGPHAPTTPKHAEAKKIHGNGHQPLKVDTTHGSAEHRAEVNAPTVHAHPDGGKIHGHGG